MNNIRRKAQILALDKDSIILKKRLKKREIQAETKIITAPRMLKDKRQVTSTQGPKRVRRTKN